MRENIVPFQIPHLTATSHTIWHQLPVSGRTFYLSSIAFNDRSACVADIRLQFLTFIIASLSEISYCMQDENAAKSCEAYSDWLCVILRGHTSRQWHFGQLMEQFQKMHAHLASLNVEKPYREHLDSMNDLVMLFSLNWKDPQRNALPIQSFKKAA